MHGQIALLSRSWSRDSGPGSLGLRADDNFLVHLHDQSQYKLITSGQPLDTRPSCVARLLLGAVSCVPQSYPSPGRGGRERARSVNVTIIKHQM